MNPNSESTEDIEGHETSSSELNLGDYPLDDVMVRSEVRTVAETVKRIESGRFMMDPDFQRDFVWSTDKQSKLIESCVMRIPLPVFYVAELIDGKVAVVDGLQRLSSFRYFLSDKHKLTGLGKNHPLLGKKFSELPLNLQERIEDTQITLYILDKNAPDRARLDIFERVNSGEVLSRQQMRNAIYNGPGTRWLADMADNINFKTATGGSLNPKTMRDREAINRFAAFHLLGFKSYTKGDMDEFLAEALRQMNKMDNEKLEQMKRDFIGSMKINKAIFGKHAFRKSLRENSKNASRTTLNISLFDVMSTCFAPSKLNLDNEKYNLVHKTMSVLLNDYEFDDVISRSTNSTRPVHTRHQMMSNALKDFTE